MSMLSLYLPPFASDYSGAASALFDLDCLIAINDGSCCTLHYVKYDEPRWNSGRKQTLCTNLRMKDTVFGIDERVVAQLGEAAVDLKAKRIVALGTPVPSVIGTDMEGLASELECSTRIPSFGIDTTGFSTYVSGICKAFELVMRFAEKDFASGAKGPFVNILGLTPLDFSVDSEPCLGCLLESKGISVGANLFMGTREDTLGLIPHAACNVAVSYAGVLMAQSLQKRFGTPYVSCGFTDELESEVAVEAIRDILDGGEAHPKRPYIQPRDPRERILVVGDQVIANSMRQALIARSAEEASIVVGSFFGLSPQESQPDDVVFSSESQFIQHLEEHDYSTIVGDPLLLRVPAVKEREFIPLVHPAISSRLYRGQEPCAGRPLATSSARCQ